MNIQTWMDQRSAARDAVVIKAAGMGIAAYIIVVGLGMVRGFDVPALLSSALNHPVLGYAGQGLVIAGGLMLLCGFYTRPVAAGLAALILIASGVQNLTAGSSSTPDAFAADLVLIFGLFACFWSPRPVPTEPAVPGRHQATAAPALWPQPLKITPRRVARVVAFGPEPENGDPVICKSGVLPAKSNSFEEPDIIMTRLVARSGPKKRKSEEPSSLYA